MVPRSITTGRTCAAVGVGSDGRPTVRTPYAAAVRSSTTGIIPAALTGEFIVGPLSGAAPDTFATAFLGRIPDAAGLPCMITGGADVAMGCYTARPAAGNIAAVATCTITPLRFVAVVVVYTEVQRLPRLI